MHLIIRADASSHMGTGHVMRCLALAQWAKKLRVPCTLMGRVQVPWVAERLANEGIEFLPLLGDIPKEENVDEFMQSLSAAPQDSWVVLDGYHFTLECQKAVRAAGHKLLIIDDYAHLPEYSCDILLNQNIGAEELIYNGDIGEKCLGLEYVLLRQEFIEARKKANKRIYPPMSKKILLTLGGGDFITHLQKIASYFTIPEFKGKTLRIIAGAMQEESIRKSLENCPANIEILHNVSDMPALLLDTDLCISAGGSTCWELCCLGVPFVPISIAENQNLIVRHFEGMGIRMPASKLDFVSLLQDAVERERFSILAKNIISGHGVVKIFSSIITSEVVFKLAVKNDCKRIFDLISDPSVSSMSSSAHIISFEEHVVWFEQYLQQRDNFFYLGFLGSSFLGYVRFDAQFSILNAYSVSIVVDKHWRNKGIGSILLRETCQKVIHQGGKNLFANIRQENEFSVRLFQKSGFVVKDIDRLNDMLNLQMIEQNSCSENLLPNGNCIRSEYEESALFTEEYQMVKWASQASMQNRFQLATKVLPFSQAGTWLDIGCGPGTFQAYVEKQYQHMQCVGLDITLALINYAKAREDITSCKFVLGDFVEFKNSYFDIITCIGVLQRTNFTSKVFFEKAYELLTSGGYVFLDTKNFLWEKFTSKELIPDPHLQWFTLEQLCYEAKECGFEILEQSGFCPHSGAIVAAEESPTIYLVAKKVR